MLNGKRIGRPSNLAAVDESFKKAPNPKAKGAEQAALAY